MKAYYADFEKHDIFYNMALDEYCYNKISAPVVRFYAFDEPSMTIGYNQRYGNGFDVGFIEEKAIPVTRRITGGRAVFHDGDLTYSFTAPLNCFSSENGETQLESRYKKLSEVFLNGFKRMNIDVALNDGKSEKPFTANCFTSSSIYEITLKGKKILGSAQVFSENAFLQQGTILVKNGVYNPKSIYGENLQNNIENLTGIDYNIKNLADGFYESFFNLTDFEWEHFEFDETDKTFLELSEKYKNSDWIKRV